MSGPIKKIAGVAAKKGAAGTIMETIMKVAPWKITGPTSGAEWKEVPVGADEYRVVAPASQPPIVRIPHSDPDKIYDVRYHTRDTRRSMMPAHNGYKYNMVTITPENFEEILAMKQPDCAMLVSNRHPFQNAGQAGSGYEVVSILDNSNGGYT
eukprot:CAMPEP_0197600824 /NCGR_PEP_ID=MMETSP1326-20131121/34063_1 /TAXON_ID=1155430 /ORGANISM="Genus nov. species nov., Strain RCC2288" /LENGTH=152 /DNA_ID=CAMNT_0043167963 /DNA_START=75 /DNA_END=533 /DNA_ORIENTATION=+